MEAYAISELNEVVMPLLMGEPGAKPSPWGYSSKKIAQMIGCGLF